MCVCLYRFTPIPLRVFIVFITFPSNPPHQFHRIREDRANPRVAPASYGISSFWLPRIRHRFVISTSKTKIPKKIALKLCFELISRFCESFVVLIHRELVFGRGLALFAFPQPGLVEIPTNLRFLGPIPSSSSKNTRKSGPNRIICSSTG